jgi:hypothetical protein
MFISMSPEGVADEHMLIDPSGRKQSAQRFIELALEIAPLLR